MIDPKEGAVQKELPGHRFSQKGQGLFTRKNTGVEVKPLDWSRAKGAQRLCFPDWAVLQREETGKRS